VQPHPGTVAWARGQLPTPHGPLKVSWSNGRNAFTLTVDAPRGTSGTITVPASARTARVVVNGRTVRALPGHAITVRG
jgi:Bacterial alpha-L-rhamnosidase C-terminal domain